MTIFGGVFALDADRQVDRGVGEHLQRALSRNSADQATLHSDSGYTAAFLDLQLLPGNGRVTDQSGAFTMLAGDLLLRPRLQASRDSDLQTFHRSWLEGDDSPLAKMRGSFAVAQIDPARGVLRLAVDVLGARSLYVAFTDGLVYFATALRILEQLPMLERRIDRRGLFETVAFGFPLATRTQYRGVELLYGGEVLEIRRGGGVRRQRHSRLEDSRDRAPAPHDLASELHRSFREAVRWRRDDSPSVVALFSGGLDSRCVVAALRADGVAVHSINVAPEGSLDLELGRVAARHLQTNHFEFPDGSDDGFERVAAGHASWLSSLEPESRPRSPCAAWSGHGGSVAMGHVYLDDPMIELMRQGRRADAVDVYLRNNNIGLSAKGFRREFRGCAESVCAKGVMDELQQLDSFEEGRRLHLFLMLNDQRRHLTFHHENLDLFRFELINPFFDPEFLRLVLSAPIQPFLCHRFYNTWLKQFPFQLDSIPWQAYEGHEPCSMPMPSGFRSQWEEDYYSHTTKRQASEQLLSQSSKAIASNRFPSGILRRNFFLAAWWLTRAGVRDYSYLLKTAATFTDYFSRSRP